jgi:hypothetical protein
MAALRHGHGHRITSCPRALPSAMAPSAEWEQEAQTRTHSVKIGLARGGRVGAKLGSESEDSSPDDASRSRGSKAMESHVGAMVGTMGAPSASHRGSPSRRSKLTRFDPVGVSPSPAGGDARVVRHLGAWSHAQREPPIGRERRVGADSAWGSPRGASRKTPQIAVGAVTDAVRGSVQGPWRVRARVRDGSVTATVPASAQLCDGGRGGHRHGVGAPGAAKPATPRV